MLNYYECWQGRQLGLIDHISIDDEEITKNLKTVILQDKNRPYCRLALLIFRMRLGILCFGTFYFRKRKRPEVLPIFVNDKMVLRPMAGKRLMDVLLDTGSRLTVKTTTNLSDEEYNQLEKLSMDFAYDTFLELKEKQLQKNLKSYNKYMYALKLRTEAAENIGIENIRTSRLLKLEKEKAAIESEFQKGKQVYPDFRLTLLVRLEA